MRSDEDREQALGLLAEFGPQDAVEIGVLDVGIAGERLGERRLAVAARAAQRRGDAGDRIALRGRAGGPSARRIPSGGRRNPPAAPAPSSARVSARRLAEACRSAPSSAREGRDRRHGRASAAILLRSMRPGPLTGQTDLALLAGKPNFLRTTALASAPGVTTRTKCWSSFDRRASSIWLHQSRPPSSATRSCQTERFSFSSVARSSRAKSAPSLRE